MIDYEKTLDEIIAEAGEEARKENAEIMKRLRYNSSCEDDSRCLEKNIALMSVEKPRRARRIPKEL